MFQKKYLSAFHWKITAKKQNCHKTRFIRCRDGVNYEKKVSGKLHSFFLGFKLA
jgi:hypothetical protein